jgi:hypothetical protein
MQVACTQVWARALAWVGSALLVVAASLLHAVSSIAHDSADNAMCLPPLLLFCNYLIS